MRSDYEVVIGIETHAELLCDTKIFCSCKTAFGDEPNTHICPVCMGLPGALPTLNKKAVALATRAGLALNCEITRKTKLDRKNYFYPDLPKAYQISQYDKPLCKNGHLDIETESGKKRIGITRIHIEEDAGKLIHRGDETLIDSNRCGVPLIEIVSEADISSAEEAVKYLEALRLILLYTGVCDCKMNEGSIRFDVNLSVRKKGDTVLGTRTEIKNLNSFQFTKKAIEYEARRQIEVIESGGKIVMETRRFDADTGKTYPMRLKETQDDYRFFREPDIPPFEISEAEIEREKAEIPELPEKRIERYKTEYAIRREDAEVLCETPLLSDYFDRAASMTPYPRTVANLIISEASAIADGEITDAVHPNMLASLSELFGGGEINSATMKKLLRRMWKTGLDPKKIVDEEGLRLIKDDKKITEFVLSAIESSPKSVEDYKRGKTNAATAVIGQVMRLSGGLCDPDKVRRIVTEELEKR